MARPPADAKTSGQAAPAAPRTTATPSGRTAYLARPGPAKPKGRWGEVIAGVLGLVLLVASGVLAVTLPKHDVLPPQFKVTFQESRVDLPSQDFSFDLADAQRHDFFFNITQDNVIQLQVNVYFEDDIVASDPDRFSIEVYDPSDNPVPPARILSNPVPQQNGTEPGRYDATMAMATYTFGLLPRPDDTVVEGALNATEASVAQEHERLNRFNTNGTWRVHVVLIQAGGCPTPSAGSPNSDAAIRGAACLRQNSAAADPRKDDGNPFTVGSFSYVHFTVSAERLD